MVKHTQAIRRQRPTNCLSVFDHFVGLAFKGFKTLFLLTGWGDAFSTYAKFSRKTNISYPYLLFVSRGKKD